MPKMHFHQSDLILKLQEYVGSVEGSLPYDSHLGLCLGLVGYWLYCKRRDLEDEFCSTMDYALTWTPDKLNARGIDPRMEHLINDIIILQHDQMLRFAENNTSLSGTLKFASNITAAETIKEEYQHTFVFTKKNLAIEINSIAFPDKMIKIENGFHAVGLMYSNGVYYFYDPDAIENPKEFLTATAVADAIHESLAAYCEERYCASKKYIALNIRVVDLWSSDDTTYPDPANLNAELMQDPTYKKAVLEHPNIFHLAAFQNDYAVMDLLFASGYTYLPWRFNNIPEMNGSVLISNVRLFEYLVEHDIPLDYRNATGRTPIGDAIANGRYDMLFNLLMAGADPNANPTDEHTMLMFAIEEHTSPEALMLLLAFEMDVPKTRLILLHLEFNRDEIELIYNHALVLNAKILGLTPEFNLDSANGEQIIAFLHHAKLIEKLKNNLNLIVLKSGGRIYSGLAALNAIKGKIFQKHEISDFSQKTEIYNLLKHFKAHSLDIKSYYLRHKAQQAKHVLEKCLSINGVQNIKLPHRQYLLFGSKNCRLATDIEYNRDIKPNLLNC